MDEWIEQWEKFIQYNISRVHLRSDYFSVFSFIPTQWRFFAKRSHLFCHLHCFSRSGFPINKINLLGTTLIIGLLFLLNCHNLRKNWQFRPLWAFLAWFWHSRCSSFVPELAVTTIRGWRSDQNPFVSSLSALPDNYGGNSRVGRFAEDSKYMEIERTGSWEREIKGVNG